MPPKAEIYTFMQIKEILKMHKDTLLNVFNSTVNRLEKKTDILKEENSSLKKGHNRSTGQHAVPQR